MLIIQEPCKQFRSACNLKSCERLYDEIEIYMQCCAEENEDRRVGILPSVEGYWSLRTGTSGVRIDCALAMKVEPCYSSVIRVVS